MRYYGLPGHALDPKFFTFISDYVGTFVCLDEETSNQKKLDVAKFMIRTKYSLVLNETINVDINDHVYSIKLVEDMHGPKRLYVPTELKDEDSSVQSLSEEGGEDVDDGEWNTGDSSEAEEERARLYNLQDFMIPKTDVGGEERMSGMKGQEDVSRVADSMESTFGKESEGSSKKKGGK